MVYILKWEYGEKMSTVNRWQCLNCIDMLALWLLLLNVLYSLLPLFLRERPLEFYGGPGRCFRARICFHP